MLTSRLGQSTQYGSPSSHRRDLNFDLQIRNAANRRCQHKAFVFPGILIPDARVRLAQRDYLPAYVLTA
jgi:hypothetical protein